MGQDCSSLRLLTDYVGLAGAGQAKDQAVRRQSAANTLRNLAGARHLRVVPDSQQTRSILEAVRSGDVSRLIELDAEPPAWQPDSDAPWCTLCGTSVMHRHHCRRCGFVICDQCSAFAAAKTGSGEERVCRGDAAGSKDAYQRTVCAAPGGGVRVAALYYIPNFPPSPGTDTQRGVYCHLLSFAIACRQPSAVHWLVEHKNANTNSFFPRDIAHWKQLRNKGGKTYFNGVSVENESMYKPWWHAWRYAFTPLYPHYDLYDYDYQPCSFLNVFRPVPSKEHHGTIHDGPWWGLVGDYPPRPLVHCLQTGDAECAEWLLRHGAELVSDHDRSPSAPQSKHKDHGVDELISGAVDRNDAATLKVLIKGVSHMCTQNPEYARSFVLADICASLKDRSSSDQLVTELTRFLDDEQIFLHMGADPNREMSWGNETMLKGPALSAFPPSMRQWLLDRSGEMQIDWTRGFIQAIRARDDMALRAFLEYRDGTGRPLRINYNLEFQYPSERNAKRTLLHEAAKADLAWVVEELLQRGASADARDERSAQRPIDVAPSGATREVLAGWDAAHGGAGVAATASAQKQTECAACGGSGSQSRRVYKPGNGRWVTVPAPCNPGCTTTQYRQDPGSWETEYSSCGTCGGRGSVQVTVRVPIRVRDSSAAKTQSTGDSGEAALAHLERQKMAAVEAEDFQEADRVKGKILAELERLKASAVQAEDYQAAGQLKERISKMQKLATP